MAAGGWSASASTSEPGIRGFRAGDGLWVARILERVTPGCADLPGSRPGIDQGHALAQRPLSNATVEIVTDHRGPDASP